MNKLKPGDTIGFFSPSTPITALTPKRFEQGKKFLTEKGFRLKAGALTGKSDFYRSGSIKERAEELNALIYDPEVRCIMSTIGGSNSNAIVPYIDYEAFKSDPKPIIGFSDVTAILLAVYAQTGITTYYGPALVASFGEWPPFNEWTYDSFQQVLMNATEEPIIYRAPIAWTDEYIPWEEQNRKKDERPNTWLTLKPGKVTGRLIAGNLNTMKGIWGSPYMPEIRKGDILMIEDAEKDASIVEKNFALLKANGVFDRIGGLILGKHAGFNDLGTNRQPHEILLEILGHYDFPLLAEFDSAHTHPMLTMPIGATIELDATKQTVTLLNY
ncbi:MAG: S66 family peptidase [Tuberibacillus sp.]